MSDIRILVILAIGGIVVWAAVAAILLWPTTS